jgi:2-polyprenyl-6-methoxyphenol hydroxylase-like FAD-dependent oxidoreductase
MVDSFDAVIAGGSFAGACAAAALERLGMRVLICEPGLAGERRLAGELIQAPGARALAELGLLDAAWEAGAVPSCGFAVLPDRHAAPIILSYGETPGCHSTGIGLEHAVLAKALLAEVGRRPGVTVRRTRIVAATGFHDAAVHLETDDGRRLETSLLVAADGRNSRLRDAAGIGVLRGPPVRMAGVRVKGPLPHEGYGHVMLGGRAPVLAYRIAHDSVRVLFTEVDGDARPYEEDLHAMPAALAEQCLEELTRQRGATTVVYALTPVLSARGRLFLAGDSGGCVHPITATGIAFCATDALRLARALEQTKLDVLAASQRYHVQREAPLRTRATLGPLLADTLTASAPETRWLRRGLVRYWQHDREGRGASMGLLSTFEPRLTVLAREYVKVMGYAVREILDSPSPGASRLGLSRKVLTRGGLLALEALRARRGARRGPEGTVASAASSTVAYRASPRPSTSSGTPVHAARPG